MNKTIHPYRTLEDRYFYRRFRRQLQEGSPNLFNLFNKPKFAERISVMSFGSCFAENIIPYLAHYGIDYVRTENILSSFPHLVGQDGVGYSVFSCEYGNIYTPKHALQLFGGIDEGLERERQCGFQLDENNCLIDLLRPAYPSRASSIDQFINRRRSHRYSCHEAVKSSSHAIITLGLSEGWESISSGLAVPSCPGVIAGNYDSKFHIVNYSLESLKADLSQLFEAMKAINPLLEIILTVSPVPMIASALCEFMDNVLVANSIAKSKLVMTATVFASEVEYVEYFPSFELITGDLFGVSSFEDDGRTLKRSVLDAVFFQMLNPLELCRSDRSIEEQDDSDAFSSPQQLAHKLSMLECEESRYDP